MKVDQDAIVARAGTELALLVAKYAPMTTRERQIALSALMTGIQAGAEMMMNVDELVK